MNDYRKLLTTLRFENGMTKEQLAQELGVSNMTIYRWESGTHNPPPKTLEKIKELIKKKGTRRDELEVMIKEIQDVNHTLKGFFKLLLTIEERIKFYNKTSTKSD